MFRLHEATKPQSRLQRNNEEARKTLLETFLLSLFMLINVQSPTPSTILKRIPNHQWHEL